jgi:hypothetical protein
LSKHIDPEKLSSDDLHMLYLQVMAAVQATPVLHREYDDMRDEYKPYIDRADARLRTLAAYNTPSVLQIH